MTQCSPRPGFQWLPRTSGAGTEPMNVAAAMQWNLTPPAAARLRRARRHRGRGDGTGVSSSWNRATASCCTPMASSKPAPGTRVRPGPVRRLHPPQPLRPTPPCTRRLPADDSGHAPPRRQPRRRRHGPAHRMVRWPPGGVDPREPPGSGYGRGHAPQSAACPAGIGSALVRIAAGRRDRERMRVASERWCQAAGRSAREWVACSMRRCRYSPRVASSAVGRPVRTAVAKARRRIGQHSSWLMSAVS